MKKPRIIAMFVAASGGAVNSDGGRSVVIPGWFD
jgi:hypothetical protein